jgi:hypothetical protein
MSKTKLQLIVIALCLASYVTIVVGLWKIHMGLGLIGIGLAGMYIGVDAAKKVK